MATISSRITICITYILKQQELPTIPGGTTRLYAAILLPPLRKDVATKPDASTIVMKKISPTAIIKVSGPQLAKQMRVEPQRPVSVTANRSGQNVCLVNSDDAGALRHEAATPKATRMKDAGIASFLAAMMLAGCSPPLPVSQEELVKLLAEVVPQGSYQFQQNTWPLLKNKTITYCGRADEVRVLETGSVVLIPVEQAPTGEKLPWLLEGKATSPDLARPHKPGEQLCITGVLEHYNEVRDRYWGQVKLGSVEKAPTS
jgi:hypothetical protein